VIMVCDYNHNHIGYSLDAGQMNVIVASIKKCVCFCLTFHVCVCVCVSACTLYHSHYLGGLNL